MSRLDNIFLYQSSSPVIKALHWPPIPMASYGGILCLMCFNTYLFWSLQMDHMSHRDPPPHSSPGWVIFTDAKSFDDMMTSALLSAPVHCKCAVCGTLDQQVSTRSITPSQAHDHIPRPQLASFLLASGRRALCPEPSHPAIPANRHWFLASRTIRTGWPKPREED